MKDVLQPYINNDSLKRTLGIKIKKAFNEFILDDLISKIIIEFENFDSKKSLQLKAYEGRLLEAEDQLNKREQDIIMLFRIIIVLGIFIVILVSFIIYLIL